MRQGRYSLTRQAVQQHAAGLLQEHLGLRDYSRRCTAAVLVTALLAAAAWAVSLHAVCRWLRGLPSDQTLRDALAATLPGAAELARRLNLALAAHLPRALRRRRQKLACDVTLIPYHGQPYRSARELCRSKPKGGTTHFHAYATAYVVRRGRRYTLALTAVAGGETMADVLQRLLRRVRQLGVRAELVLLDRGFYAVDVIRYLQRAQLPFLMPARFPGRAPSRKGSPAFRFWWRSGWAEHHVINAKKERAAVHICVVCRPALPPDVPDGARRRGGRKGQRPKRRRWFFACWGLGRPDYAWVAQTYRSRFAIETSYRQMHQARARTSTRQPLLRLLYIGLALLLRNVWVWLHDQVLAGVRCGRAHPRLERLRFRHLLRWLVDVIAQANGLLEEVITDLAHPPKALPRKAAG